MDDTISRQMNETVSKMENVGDTISRRAAIDAIQNEVEPFVMVEPGTTCVIGAGVNDADVIRVLEQLPSAQPEQRWIPCSERLPEEVEGQYWVCTNTGYQCQCRWTDDVYGLGSNGEWAWKIFDIPQYSHVTAWRRLPEPYREEGEKDA